MLRVGLTGGIASGKSRVLVRFAGAGFRTIDLDRVSRDVMAPGAPAYSKVAAAFGPSILRPDGTVDRGALGRIVFADPAARHRLESIVHPLIRAAEQELRSSSGEKAAVVDAALLVETGSHLRFDRLIVVYCEPEEQLRRVMVRDGLPEKAARARMDAQMPPSEKRGFGHFIVDASGSLADTDARADEVIGEVQALAERPLPPAAVGAARAVTMMDAGPDDGPRGLSPWTLLDSLAAQGTLDLAHLATVLRPAHTGPWYAAPKTGPPGRPPETLAVPVALWCAARRPGDEALTIAAAASLARLTHRSAEDIAGAIVAALAAQHALEGGEGASLRDGVPRWVEAAAGWAGGTAPPAVIGTVLAAAEAHGRPDQAARFARTWLGVEGLARALASAQPAVQPSPERFLLMEKMLRAAAV